jgi:ribosome-binding factor A
MSIDRIVRLNALLRREIAEGLFRVVDEDGFDFSTVTVTQVAITRDLREARVWVSIRDTPERRPAVLHILKRHRADIQSLINKDLGLKYTPRLSFALDESVEKGDRVLGLLSSMDREAVAEPPPDPSTP